MWIWELAYIHLASTLIKRLVLAILVTEPSFDLADKIFVSHHRIWRFTRWERERDINREPNNHIHTLRVRVERMRIALVSGRRSAQPLSVIR